MSTVINVFKDEALEATAREAIRLDESQALLEKFVTLVRESGTPDEEVAGPLHRRSAEGSWRAGDAAHAGAVHQQSGARRAEHLDRRRGGAPAWEPRPVRPYRRGPCTRGRRRWAAPPATPLSRARSATCPRSMQAARPRCSIFQTPLAAEARTTRCAGASCSPRGSRCRPRSARSSDAAPSRRSSSTPGRTCTKASAPRSGARQPPNRWDANPRCRSSASIMRTARR